MMVPKQPTKRQAQVLAYLADSGGEALREGGYFRIGARQQGCEVPLMEKLASMHLVKLEQVGSSLFANITDAGRAAIMPQS